MNVLKLRAMVRKYGDAGALFAGFCVALRLLAIGAPAEGEGFSPPKKSAPEKRGKPYLPTKPLLASCIPLLKVGARCEGVYWLTSDKAIIISRNRDKPYNAPLEEEWRGKVELFNRGTGKIALLKGLTRVINSAALPPENFEMSPNGKWVTWWAWSTPTGYDATIARLNGKDCQYTHGNKHSTDYWVGGDTRVCQEQTDSEKASSSVLHVLNPNTASFKEISVSSSEAKAIIKRVGKREKRVVTALCTDNHIAIDVFKSEEFHLSNGNPSTPSQNYQARLPGKPYSDGEFQPIISPHGRKVACIVPYPVAFLKSGEPSRFRISFFVCNADGTALSNKGYLHFSGLHEGRSAEAPLRANFQWLPDGKNLSFTYKGTLYLLPVK